MDPTAQLYCRCRPYQPLCCVLSPTRRTVVLLPLCFAAAPKIGFQAALSSYFESRNNKQDCYIFCVLHRKRSHRSSVALVSHVFNEEDTSCFFMAQVWKPNNIRLTRHKFLRCCKRKWYHNMVYSSKSSKGTPFPLRSMLVFFIALFDFYVCYFSFTQIALENEEEEEMNDAEERTKVVCARPSSIPYEQMQYVHFPRPMSYDRGECGCTPVRFFVIVSMQRSGSGWFETLFNSHPNVSSNGEIFSLRERREDIASILWTLDKLYDLDLCTSAAKNECTAAFGLKWMLNQGLMDYPDEIVDYLIKKGVMVIFLFRRNTLRRLVSVMANDYDRRAKQLNGTHKAHVHSQEEAEILARFKPEVEVSSLIPSMRSVEQAMDACLRRFRATRHMVLYYEDVVRDDNALARVQEFLGVPVRRLSSRHVKIHTSPLPDLVANWEDVRRALKPTEFAPFLDQ